MDDLRRKTSRKLTGYENDWRFLIRPVVRCDIFRILDRGGSFLGQQALDVNAVNGRTQGQG